MIINDLIGLKNVLKDIKLGKISNDVLRKYLRLSLELNKYNDEWENKRKNLYKETADTKGYDVNSMTDEQHNDVLGVIIPIFNEYLATPVSGIETKIFTWDELCNAILNVEQEISNESEDGSKTTSTKLTTEQQTFLIEMLCNEEL